MTITKLKPETEKKDNNTFDMTRTEIINYLIEKNNFETYLEIGIRNPDDNFNHIRCKSKIGVDPIPLSHDQLKVFGGGYDSEFWLGTSNDFFEKSLLRDSFDVIFIDGLHVYYQVLRDLENSLIYLNEGGYIIVHDSLPEKEIQQTVPAQDLSSWFGDVWKAVVIFNSTHQSVHFTTVDTDCGCAIFQNHSGTITFKPDFKKEDLDWKFYEENKKNLLHVISVDEFKTIY